MQRRPQPRRLGFSLLELLVTSVVLATVVTSAVMVLRGSQTAWSAHVSDHSRLEAGYASLRHITRQVRQATSVVSISAANDTSGALSVVTPDGSTVVWDHSGTAIYFGVGAPTSLLASGVNEISFVGYKADGVTTTTMPYEIQSILCTITVPLARSASPTRTLRTRIWLRSI